MTNRREQLEKEVELAERRIKEAPKNTPKEVMNNWRQMYDDLSFELNNLYDDEDDDNL